MSFRQLVEESSVKTELEKILSQSGVEKILKNFSKELTKLDIKNTFKEPVIKYWNGQKDNPMIELYTEYEENGSDYLCLFNIVLGHPEEDNEPMSVKEWDGKTFQYAVEITEIGLDTLIFMGSDYSVFEITNDQKDAVKYLTKGLDRLLNAIS